MRGQGVLLVAGALGPSPILRRVPPWAHRSVRAAVLYSYCTLRACSRVGRACHPVCNQAARGCRVEPVHIARVRVYQEKRPNRRAFLGDFPDPIRYGVNAGVKAFYKMEPEEELPSTLDHLVAAAAG